MITYKNSLQSICDQFNLDNLFDLSITCAIHFRKKITSYNFNLTYWIILGTERFQCKIIIIKTCCWAIIVYKTLKHYNLFLFFK